MSLLWTTDCQIFLFNPLSQAVCFDGGVEYIDIQCWYWYVVVPAILLCKDVIVCRLISATLWLVAFSSPVVRHFPFSHWFCLLLSSMLGIPWRIFHIGGLVVIYCFRFCLVWKIFISPSILNDSFAGYSFLRLKLFPFSAWDISPHTLLAFKVSFKKFADFCGC
jgi:hypothetical protein